MSAEEALAALARDLVEEIAAGRAIELAAQQQARNRPEFQVPSPNALPFAYRPKQDAAAVFPVLGQHLMRLPGDTVSCQAYKHLGVQPPQAAPPPGRFAQGASNNAGSAGRGRPRRARKAAKLPRGLVLPARL